MKPVLLVSVAMVLYAVQNVVLEQKLAKFPVAAILICGYVVMLPLALVRWGFLYTTDRPEFPSGAMLTLALIVGLTWFVADYCYIAAYAAGGTLISVTTVAIMLPVFASVVKFVWTRELPNAYQVAGYAFAVIAIFLVGKGEA